jgi:hypothetical protein
LEDQFTEQAKHNEELKKTTQVKKTHVCIMDVETHGHVNKYQ